jgi:signal transduction histidine kinase
MGELMRSIDWSKTEVGAEAHWPQSLRTALSILLETRFPMYIAWGAGFTQFYNDGYRPILGSTKHPAAMGRSSRETFAEIWDIIGPMFEGVMQGNAVGFDDFMLPLDRHGFVEECYFIFSYSPIRDESGGVGGVLVTVTETTSRVLSERRLRTLRDLAACAADAKSVEQACAGAMKALAENRADVPFAMLYLIEAEGTRARLSGTSGAEGSTPATPDVIDMTAAAGTAWPLAAVARAGKAELVCDVMERFGKLPGGPWPEAPCCAMVLPIARAGQDRPYGFLIAGTSPRLAVDDDYRGFFGLVADHCATGIANARAYEEERLRAEKLAELDRAKTAFFSNISHEFRTPLTLMLGPTRDALDGPDAALSGDDLRTVHRNALRLLKLVNALLEFSRIEAGRIQAAYEPTDLARLTEELASGFRSAVERAGLTLAVETPPLSQPAYVDREMWEKIVLNLLSNAFKFTFDGGITVTLREGAGGFEVAVADTGTGIPAHELPNVFKRFHRIEGARARTHEGSGIGLALVQELVRLHGGEIRVASEPGQGTTFTVSIPYGSAHLPPDRIGARRSLPSTGTGVAAYVEEALRWLPEDRPAGQAFDAASAPAWGRPVEASREARILLADDNADMRSYARRLLAERWQVEAVADGAAALAAARREPPDLVLSDVMMPGLDGYALLRALRADPRTRDIPIILLSARAGEESRVEGLAAGAEDYLAKPFWGRELIARVSTHLELSRLRRESREEHRKLYALFMQAPAPIAVIRGDDLVFEMANALYVEVVGGREVAGKSLLEALPELAGQGFDDLLHTVMRTGQAHIGKEIRVELDRRGTGAREGVYFTYIYAPMQDPDGSCERVMVFCSDVTEQVVARQKIEEADRRKDEFLAMLAHELRNPLAPIRTALQLLRMRDRTFDRPLEIIDRQTANLARLVDDLLDVSRLTRGRIELRSERVELAGLVNRAVDAVRQMLEERQHAVSVALPPRPLVIAGDPVRLEQILINLLGNAAKYTDPGGRIRVTLARVQGTAEIQVEDTGNGIDAEMLPKVFNLFEQAARTLDRAQGGLGIGLTIVRTLVELHGGTVEAHSAGRGQGSTFVVRLPLAAEEPGVAEDDAPAARAPGAHDEPALRVLVVDDNVDAAETMADLFRTLGHEVRVCHDGRSVRGVVVGYRPHLVLLDIGLPEMDGYEVARELRQAGVNPGMLVALTGYGQEGDRQRALDAGFAQHLVKPVSFATLRQLLDGLGAAGAGAGAGAAASD